MIENDVGGGFGARGEFYPEDFLIPFAARHVNRPVKWIEDRRENLMAMNHAREAEVDVEIACARDGTILALRGHIHTDMGAYMRTNGAVGARNIAQFMAGPYRVPDVKLDVSLWMTNKTPVGTYRGPGRFETDFFRERLFDIVAQDLGIDRVEFRRKNLIAHAEMPYRIADISPYPHEDDYDSGDYAVTLERCLKEIGWAEKANMQGQLIDGRYHGLAIGCFIEGGAAGPKETAGLAVNDDGTISVFIGSSAVGQGVETVFAQIAADALEIPMDRIRGVYHGSTAYVSDGYGAYHSRSVVMGGSALLDAANNFQDGVAARRRRRSSAATAAEIRFDEDKVSGANGKSLPLSAFAGLSTEGAFLNKKHTYSYGAQAAHVAVDPKLGQVEIVDYVVVQDAGRIINPLTLRGQVIGSLVQGLGGAFLEHLVYDEQGQLLTGSLADYLLPTASDFPRLRAIVMDRASLADQSARRQGCGRGRHDRRRRRDRERGGERAAIVQSRPARAAAVAAAHLGDGAGGPHLARSQQINDTEQSMANLRLTFACGPYDRTQPLRDGTHAAGRHRAHLPGAAAGRNLLAHAAIQGVRRLRNVAVELHLAGERGQSRRSSPSRCFPRGCSATAISSSTPRRASRARPTSRASAAACRSIP